MTINLGREAGGNLGERIESFLLTKAGTGQEPLNEMFESVLHPTLIAGQTYFVTCEAADSLTNGSWYQNDVWARGRILVSVDDGTSWSAYDNEVLPAVRISGEPVPEPATLATIASGIALVTGRRRRR